MSVSVSVSDLWRGMVFLKSHVSELKNWMPMHSKNKKKPNANVEHRAGGDAHRSEKRGQSAGDTGQWPQKKMPIHPVSPKEVVLLGFFDLFKVSKMTILIMNCLKSAK